MKYYEPEKIASVVEHIKKVNGLTGSYAVSIQEKDFNTIEVKVTCDHLLTRKEFSLRNLSMKASTLESVILAEVIPYVEKTMTDHARKVSDATLKSGSIYLYFENLVFNSEKEFDVVKSRTQMFLVDALTKEGFLKMAGLCTARFTFVKGGNTKEGYLQMQLQVALIGSPPQTKQMSFVVSGGGFSYLDFIDIIPYHISEFVTTTIYEQFI